MEYSKKQEMPPCKVVFRKRFREMVASLLKKNGLFLIMAAVVFLFNLRFDLFYIKTGSMEPVLPVGAVVVADPCAEPKAGDIFAYQAGENMIIHRIVGVDGELYTFRGDANGTDDAAKISRSQLVGKIVLTLDFFGPLIKMLGLAGG